MTLQLNANRPNIQLLSIIRQRPSLSQDLYLRAVDDETVSTMQVNRKLRHWHRIFIRSSFHRIINVMSSRMNLRLHQSDSSASTAAMMFLTSIISDGHSSSERDIIASMF
jgi:hypothetical protein